jgi:hypothetical protein
MFQEVSFHPEERRRVKGILKTIGSDYWCVLESSQRVRAGREDCKAGASTENFEAPWVYAVVTFLHKDVFKQPTHLYLAAQYSNKAMRHMSSIYWTVYINFASQSQHKYKIIIFVFRRSK